MHDDCDNHEDCFVSKDRRTFLRETFFAATAALVGVGMSGKTAFAMPLAFTEPLGVSGSGRTYPVPAADGAQIDKDNQVILVRWQDAVYAFSLSCPHQNTALKWDEREHTFQCGKHHSKFTASGEYIAGSGRATRDMDRLAIQKDARGIAVDVDKAYQQDTDGPQWAAAVVKLK